MQASAQRTIYHYIPGQYFAQGVLHAGGLHQLSNGFAGTYAVSIYRQYRRTGQSGNFRLQVAQLNGLQLA